MVKDDSLLAFLQFRSKTIAQGSFEARLNSLSAEDLERLIGDFVREEALYREARALGLDKKDFGVRQRMIRQLEFINQGVVSSAIELTDNDLQNYFKRNQERYYEPSTITFTHVFLSTDRHGDEGAEKMAQATLEELNGALSGTLPIHEAPARGDRFLYRQSYVNREAAEIKSHFGSEMRKQLFALEPDDMIWRGPIRSRYGYHLVLVTKKRERYLPGFQELRKRLEIDAFQARLEEGLQRIESSVVESYFVVVDDELKERLEKGRLEATEKPE